MSIDSYFGGLWTPSLLLQRGIAAIYVVAFAVVLLEFKPLLRERGLLPGPNYLRQVSRRIAPSIFCWRYSDRLLDLVEWTGLVVSVCAVAGLTEAGPVWVPIGA